MKKIYLGLKALVKNNSFEIEAKVGNAGNVDSRMGKYKCPSSSSLTSLNKENIVWESEFLEDDKFLIAEQEGINAMRSLKPLFTSLNIKYTLDNKRNARDPIKYGHFGMNEELIPITKNFVFGEYKKYLASLQNGLQEISYAFGFTKRDAFSWKKALSIPYFKKQQIKLKN